MAIAARAAGASLSARLSCAPKKIGDRSRTVPTRNLVERLMCLVVVACPPGPTGESLRGVAACALPPGDAARTIDIEDEVSYYREYPAVPMTALPQLGTNWEAAYKALQEATQCSPHSRSDVTKWADVNSG